MEALYSTRTKLTREEYVQYNFTVLRHFLPYRGNLIIVYAALAVLAVFCFIKGIDMVLYGDAVGMIIFPFIYRMIVKRRIAAIYETNAQLQNSDVAIDFFEDHVTSAGDVSSIEVSYDKLFKIFETKKNYYLMLGQNEGIIVIKENCSGELLSFIRDIRLKYGL